MADRIFKLTFLGDASKAIREIDKLGGKLTGAGKLAVGAGLAAGAAMGAVAAGGIAKAITLAADYEHAIDGVAAVAQASAEQQKQLYEKGREIGRRTAFTALESAAAMEELAAQGLTVEQILNGAADATVNLAAAGGTDLVTAATGIAGTMDIWKLSAEDMEDVVNRIAGAANVSKFGVADMNLAIGQGAGVAKAAGVSYQDFLATIAASASSFSSGSDAGTGAKTFFQTIIGRSGPARKAMREFGLITEGGQNLFYDATGNFLGMANAAEVLNDAFAGLSDLERTEALQKIFGSDASRTAAALMEKGAPGFQAISEGMGNNDAAAQAAQRLGNLKGALDQLKGSLEDIGIGLGEKLLPPLAKVAEFLAEWLPKIPTEVLIAVGAFMGFIGVLSAVGLAIMPLIAIGAAFGIGLGAIVLVVGGVVLAIAAVIAIGVLLWQNWDTIKEKAGNLAEWVRNAFQKMRDGAAEFLGPVIGFIQGIIDKFAGLIELANRLPGVNIGGGSSQGVFTPVANPQWGNPDALGEGEGFGSGGVIPGPTGAPRLVMAHAGETILPTHRGAYMGGVTININGSLLSTAADIERAVIAAMQNARMRGALPA